jgi:hypothetical protein
LLEILSLATIFIAVRFIISCCRYMFQTESTILVIGNFALTTDLLFCILWFDFYGIIRPLLILHTYVVDVT